jgi:hydroxyacyl-ACP dehydratase HTD2-like protein with hotdog domain
VHSSPLNGRLESPGEEHGMNRLQRYFEEVAVDEEMPMVVRRPNRIQLFMYSAVSWNIHRIHYDKEYAVSEGHPALLVHGPLQGAFLGQYLTDWAGPEGRLKKIGWSNRGRAFADEPYIIKGRVKEKRKIQAQNLIDCEIWSENEAGERLLTGSATMALPARNGS